MNELTKQIAEQVADMLTEQKDYITMLTEKAKEINNDEESEGLNYAITNRYGIIEYSINPIVDSIKDAISTYNKTLNVFVELLRECKDTNTIHLSGEDVYRHLQMERLASDNYRSRKNQE